MTELTLKEGKILQNGFWIPFEMTLNPTQKIELTKNGISVYFTLIKELGSSLL